MVCLKIIRNSESLTDGEYKFDLSEIKDKKVSFLKSTVCSQFKLPSDIIDLLYNGCLLEDDCEISNYTIMENSTVYVVKRPSDLIGVASPGSISDFELEALSTSLRAAINDSQLRNMLIRIVNSTEGLSSLMASTPGLKNDLVAQGVLKDPYLFMHWLDNSNIRRTADQHPTIIEAAQQILATVNEEAARRGGSFAHAGMLQADEYSDEETDDDNGGEPRNAGPSNVQRPLITAQQLQMAFQQAAAAGAPSLRPTAQESPRNVSLASTQAAAPPNPGRISASFLQEAIVQAAASARQSKISQLRDMGFVDDNENIRALNATGGNVEAALEWIINEREKQ